MTGGATWAVVFVKPLDIAKRRLAGVLDAAGRRRLMRAMLADVLDALAAVPGLDGVAVMSREPGLTRELGVRALAETGTGLNAAVTEAAHVLAEQGCVTLLVVPADVPLATPDEISAVLAAGRETPGLTLVPDRHRVGTNAMACTPPTAVAPCFGAHSLARHRRAARRAGLTLTVLDLPGLGLDIDTPDDLAALRDRPGTTRAQAFLREAAGSQAALTAAPEPALGGGR